ncbi:hypothetical protein BZZ01_04995 [Nostocales cyanobacterium HT-58-2]|nr:hypothetical protein BZZ01_04995 [Nostocales cyanobacterium HT-58-2]
MAELHLSYVDNHQTVQANVGDTIVIQLPENASTGYQWDVLSFSQDLVTYEYQTNIESPPGNIGAGGSESIFRFRADAPGQSQVFLKLWRGHESDESVFKYSVTLNVS